MSGLIQIRCPELDQAEQLQKEIDAITRSIEAEVAAQAKVYYEDEVFSYYSDPTGN